MPFVFSFIAFNLLDLDGSNLTKCFDRTIIDGDIGAVPQFDPIRDRNECFKNARLLTPNVTLNDELFHAVEAHALSRIEKATGDRTWRMNQSRVSLQV